MSIDALYCRLKPHDMAYDPHFDPKDSVKGPFRLSSPGAQNLSVVIPPWHAPEFLVRHMAKKEQRLGRNVLYYMFDDSILSSNADRTLESFATIAEHVKQDVEWSNADRIRWIGTSLGVSVLLRTVGGENLPADEMTLNVPGGDLATALWTGVRTQPLRRGFEAQGVDLASLQEQWRELAPVHQAQNISGSNVTMHVSMADEVIRPDTAYQLAAALNAQNNVHVVPNAHLGHYGTILAAVA